MTPRLGRQARPLVAGRHHDGVAAHDRTIAARDFHAVRHLLHAGRFGLYATEATAAEEGIDQVRKVIPKQSPWREAVGSACGVGRRPICEPADEMPGIVGKGAHIGGADVEQMVRVVGRIGDAGAEFGTALDQHDLKRACFTAQKVNSEENATGPSSDNNDSRHAWPRITMSPSKAIRHSATARQPPATLRWSLPAS